MNTFHHASIDSDRIQRIIKALSDAGRSGLTTIQLNDICGSTRASSDVSEVRSCGIPIRCKYEGQTDSGRRVFRYRLVSQEQPELL